MAHEAVSLLEVLRDRSGGACHVVGFSFGATAAALRPDLVRTLVAVGMDVDGEVVANGAYDFAIQIALLAGGSLAALI
jgi:pimeloyl-ACP methyl ester carboxylesterase